MSKATRTKPVVLLLAGFVALVAGALLLTTRGDDPLEGPPPRAAEERPERAPTAGRTAPRYFARTSFWNARLPDDAAIDPDSERLMAAFRADIARQQRERTGPWIATHEYSTPVYTVGRGQRKVRVKIDAGPAGRGLQAAFDAGVPIPAGAQPASGTDGHLTIHQPGTDRLWELWRAVKRADVWHASWGGAMRGVSSSRGYYSDRSWPGAEFNWGSTATSLPVVGGTMLIGEVERRDIPHALAMAVRDTRSGVWAWPAQRTDGAGGPATLPAGARLRLDPSVDVDRLRLHPVGRAMALAAQRHGIVVRDVTHDATSFYAEDPAPAGEDPYPRLFGGQTPGDVLAGFPWDRLQLLRMNVCDRSPCERGPSP